MHKDGIKQRAESKIERFKQVMLSENNYRRKEATKILASAKVLVRPYWPTACYLVGSSL